MTRLKQAHAADAKRHETRMAVRAMSQKLVESAGHKPSTTLAIAVETAAADLASVAGVRRTIAFLRKLQEDLARDASAGR